MRPGLRDRLPNRVMVAFQTPGGQLRYLSLGGVPGVSWPHTGQPTVAEGSGMGFKVNIFGTPRGTLGPRSPGGGQGSALPAYGETDPNSLSPAGVRRAGVLWRGQPDSLARLGAQPSALTPTRAAYPP